MPSCVYRKCTNYCSKINKTQGISYHMFPTNEIRFQKWIAIVRKQRNESDWMPSKASRICINHFNATDRYTSKKGRTLLRKNAVPVIQEPINRVLQYSSIYKDIFGTPRKAALKNCMQQLTFQQQQLQKRNKTLTQQKIEEESYQRNSYTKRLKGKRLYFKRTIYTTLFKSRSPRFNK